MVGLELIDLVLEDVWGCLLFLLPDTRLNRASPLNEMSRARNHPSGTSGEQNSSFSLYSESLLLKGHGERGPSRQRAGPEELRKTGFRDSPSLPRLWGQRLLPCAPGTGVRSAWS